jgi:hypothetical protein
MNSSFELMEKWFLRPLEQIRAISSGDSYFIELLTACSLYERLTNARLETINTATGQTGLIDLISQDFDTTREAATAFWNVIRSGLAHQAMPVQRGREKLPEWWMHDSYPDRHAILLIDSVLHVQPRAFVDRVIELWRQHPELVTESRAFPWPKE